jgi:hypothetical protein
VCLFAAYDPDGVVDDTLVDYVRELSRFADVYLLADCFLPAVELAKLDGLVAGAWSQRHGAYDFGSWSRLARDLVGWDTLAQYDEVLLVNDSCYLLRGLDEVFARMQDRACDWWGLQATKGIAKTRDVPSNTFDDPVPMAEVHERLASFEADAVYDFLVGSYFLAFRRPVIEDAGFRRILDSVSPQESKLLVIQKYEIGIGHYLIGNGFGFDTYVSSLYPFHPIFGEWAFVLIRDEGFPLLKKYLLYQNHYDVPDLAGWAERVQALVPEAPIASMRANLHRTSPDDRLRRSFAIVSGADGSVSVPSILKPGEFKRADKAGETRDDWWAFPVCPHDHTLPANSRAILEQVRGRADVTVTVLTRSRQVPVAGANVQVLPLMSPEGQQALIRSGHVFVRGEPRRTLVRLLTADHRMYCVRDGLVLDRDGREARVGGPVNGEPVNRWSAVLTASDVDHLAAVGLNWPVAYHQGWRTGLPAHDFLVADDELLPPDVAEAERSLRDRVGGRRLVAVVPALGGGHAQPPLAPAEVAELGRWAERNDVVLAVREHPRDLDRVWSRMLVDSLPGVLDLTVPLRGLVHPLLRCADAVLTDHSGLALDFALTGRPVVAFERADPGDLVLDLEHAFPGPVTRTAGQLLDALGHLFETPDATELRRRERCLRMLADEGLVDGSAARRVVDLVLAGAIPTLAEQSA